jgi:hypothetical protein
VELRGCAALVELRGSVPLADARRVIVAVDDAPYGVVLD